MAVSAERSVLPEVGLSADGAASLTDSERLSSGAVSSFSDRWRP